MKKILYFILLTLCFFVFKSTYSEIAPNSMLKIFASKYTEGASPGLKKVEIKNIYKIDNTNHSIDNLYLIDTGVDYSVLKIENNDKKLQDLLENKDTLKNNSKTLALTLMPQFTKGYYGVESTLNMDRPAGEFNAYSQVFLDVVLKYNSSAVEKYRVSNDSNTLIPINLNYVFISPELKKFDFWDWFSLAILLVLIVVVLRMIKGINKDSKLEEQGGEYSDED